MKESKTIKSFFPGIEWGVAHLLHEHFFQEWQGETEIHTSSDVVEGVGALFTIWPSDLLLDCDLGSAPVGRPRSCRTYEWQDETPNTLATWWRQADSKISNFMGFTPCLGGHIKLGDFFGGSWGLVGLSKELHSHCEDRLMDWTSLSYKSEFQTRSVLVQTHHSIHVEIIGNYKK